jgi:putative endopeptidase
MKAVGESVGRLYVAEYFPPESKAKMQQLVANLEAALNQRIDALDWMSAETKTRAHEKLAAFTPKIGYPDKWKDYSTLVVKRDDPLGNNQRAAQWTYDYQLARLDKPVDRAEWGMTPQEINAYYNPSNNEIVFPAAILQPPFFDPHADPAVNYGGIGAVIGHEITHGFDDEGRQFDAAGNLTDWWTGGDAAKFQTRADVMARQFDAYEPMPGLHINGKASLGENIADYGGVLLGLDAFKKTEQYKEGKPIGGLTPVQRYFLGYALGWMSQQRDESLRRGLLSDVHAPAKWRVPHSCAFCAQGWEIYYSLPTRTTSKLRESLRATPSRGNTAGKFRTCADRREDVHTACSGYDGERKTSASVPCLALYQTSLRFLRLLLFLL